MRRDTIAGCLYFVRCVTLLSVAVVGAGTVYLAVGTHRAAEELYQRGILRAIEAHELELALESHRRLIEASTTATSEPSRRTEASADVLRQKIERLVERSDQAFATAVKPMLPALWRSGNGVLNGEVSAQDAVAGTYAERAESVHDMARGYRRSRADETRQVAGIMADRARTLAQWLTGLALIGAVLIGCLAFVVLRTFVSRRAVVAATVRPVVGQDADTALQPGTRGDDIGDVAEALSACAPTPEPNRWLDIAINNMSRGISMFDAAKRLVVCNEVYARTYDLPAALTRPGTPFTDILRHRARSVISVGGHEGRGPNGLEPALIELVERGQDGQSRQLLKNGRTIEVSVKPLPCGGWVALHDDVTDRLIASERITRLARQDTLTGVANRLHFREALEAAIAGLDSEGPFALLVIDLDRFKEVNDALGHPAGDALLTIVGHRLSTLARRKDLVARLGGDEFAIIQRDLVERSDVEALARRIVEMFRQPFLVHGKRIEIGGTGGVALAPGDAGTAEEMMRKADIALYRAKADGRGTVRFYDSEMEGRMRARRQLATDLAEAAKRGEFELFYQPIVSLASRRVEGCEALIRWWHPVRGMVSPAEFIPIAEETGLICEIGAWAIKDACLTAAQWRSDLSVAVNLSVAQVAGPDVVAATSAALDRSGLAANRLVLEVTETLLLGDDPATFELLHRLHNLGVAIALDDFGTGYSSLSHLRAFPFDKIKIDQSFVKDLPQRKNCEAIVGAVARLASSLEMTTVAEGVETEDHLARVEAAGCNAVQGYLFSRPVAAKDLTRVIAEIDQRLASGKFRAA